MAGMRTSVPLWWPLVMLAGGVLAAAVARRLVVHLPRVADPSLPAPIHHACHARPLWLGALPIAGWVHRSRLCRTCRQQLTLTDLSLEVALVVLWCVTAVAVGPTWRAGALALFVSVLAVLAVVDLRHLLLPDVLTLPGIAAGLAATWIPGWPVPTLTAVLTAGAGYAGMWALASAASQYYGTEAIGQGDWKLVAMLGAFLGPSKLLLTLLVGNAVGAVVGLALVAGHAPSADRKLPLGAFLGLAGVGVALL